MGRLIVEVVSGESNYSDVVWHLEMFVSVSRADDGTSVTGLTTDNFRVCAPTGLILEMALHGAYEAEWEKQDVVPAGCYSLSVTYKWETGDQTIGKWGEGEYYPFGIQARVFEESRHRPNVPNNGRTVSDIGQTVVLVQSLGT